MPIDAPRMMGQKFGASSGQRSAPPVLGAAYQLSQISRYACVTSRSQSGERGRDGQNSIGAGAVSVGYTCCASRTDDAIAHLVVSEPSFIVDDVSQNSQNVAARAQDRVRKRSEYLQPTCHGLDGCTDPVSTLDTPGRTYEGDMNGVQLGRGSI